jgi:protease PrsW
VQQTHGPDLAFYQPDAEHIAHNRRGFWLASLIELGGLFIFVAFFNLIAGIGANLDGPGLILLGLLMSLVPAVLWLLFFYRLDRLEPEPKTKLLTIFGLSALVTAAIANPLLQNFFEIDHWLYNSFGTQLLGGILLVGFVQSAVIYLVVRYGIYNSPEFDERVDGVIYAIAAGLGLSTVINFLYVIDHGGVDLGIGSVRIVVNALAYASFAGVLGYFLGQARFERTPSYYLPLGLALSATLNGIFFLMEDRVTADGLRVNPWNGLILAALFAVVTLGVVFWLINRANEETLRVASAERTSVMAATASTVIAQEEATDPRMEDSTAVTVVPAADEKGSV